MRLSIIFSSDAGRVIALLLDELRLELGLRLREASRRGMRLDSSVGLSSRHCSIWVRWRRSSLVIDWPSTLPTDARWSL